MTNCKYAKFKDGKYLSRKVQKRREIPFTQSSEKKVIMTFIFYKKNFGEDPFALGMEIHWDKRKGVLELSQRAY